MSKQQPEKTTGSLVTLIGHVTVQELRRELTDIEQGNGFANRWLWVCVKRSKRLPRGGHVDDELLRLISLQIREALQVARDQEMLGMTEEAWEPWELLYDELSEGGDDLLGAVTARAEAHVRRLAVLYALLDKEGIVGADHLRAAIAVWDYCAASAAHIFGGKVGVPFADKILTAIREAGPEGLSRTEIRAVVGGHVPAEEIDGALRFLSIRGLAHERVIETPGRPARRWIYGTRSKVRGRSEESPPGDPFAPKAQPLPSGSRHLMDIPVCTPEEEERVAALMGLSSADDGDWR
jgi:hypothetical protein